MCTWIRVSVTIERSRDGSLIEPRSFNDIARLFEIGGAYYINAEARIDSPHNSSEGSTRTSSIRMWNGLNGDECPTFFECFFFRAPNFAAFFFFCNFKYACKCTRHPQNFVHLFSW